MTVYLAIALGGSLGAVSRYWVSSKTYLWVGTEFPYGTLMVNVSGSLVMGFLAIVLSEKIELPEEVKFALLVGFLGSYTTFSTFALDALQAIQNGALLKVAVYILISVFGSLLGVWMGYLGARLLMR
ncbi:MAG: fluoride efflux transporter CrcB [Gammaproteobacteria bacterium]|jgi:CrcB protein|nr:fluoride efflux transporter CrcB [Gammaproteobacteria bacterium]MBT3722193.1 fluoride efflux transporter CrcB [Gammaproteobacteria bacterium]MBT4077997.1 fluoride efflux transporter CrcB [Gammaproteobacteria bacterium]MBT4193510.1 fluoride efflux transporter CrcB [Gammaproteobacteria bacterium]MBT4452171.1 fluoride efflux transporter CrcB [Gammaproteobacteria bacterium]